MNEEDRIRLAIRIARDPGYFAPNKDIPIFDPTNNAEHDYAVLLKVRPEDAQNSKPVMGPEHVLWRDFIFELRLLQLKRGKESSAIFEAYELGDYAMAYSNATAAGNVD